MATLDIDIQTLFFIFFLGNISIVLCFAFYIILNKVRNQIILIFTGVKAMSAILAILMVYHSTFPISLIILINVLIFFAIFNEVYSINNAHVSFNKSHFLRYNLIPLVLSLGFISFSFTSEETRIIIASLIIALIFLGGSFYLFSAKSKTIAQGLAKVLFLILAALFFARASWAFFSDTSALVFSKNIIQVTSYIFLVLVAFFTPVVLLFIYIEKSENRIKSDNIKLKELNIDKDKFFSIIAHDLRGPLGSLCQLGELLWVDDNQIDEEERKRLTEILYQSTNSTYALLDNLLKWASSNTGGMNFDPQNLNLKNIVDDNIHIFEHKGELKNIRLLNNLGDDVWVYADINMINTVIRNLISNALKFTYDDGKIEVITKNLNDTSHSIAVVDDGVGMNKNAATEVFEISSTKTTLGTHKEKGYGLGLKLCQEFITKNSGEIWIESEEGVGTEVWISLPKANLLEKDS